MRRLVCAALTALALTAVGAPANGAAATTRTLTIDAPGSAYVDVRISRPLVFDLDGATFRGGRSYMGVVLDRVAPTGAPTHLLHVRFPAVAAKPGSAHTLGLDQSERPLPPGMYRLYVLSDGPARFSIRVSGLSRDLRLTPTRRVAPRYYSIAVPQVIDPVNGTPYGGAARVPGIAAGAGALAVARFGVRFASGPVTADGWDFCVTPTGDECLQPPGLDGYAFGVDSAGDTMDVTTYLPPDVYEPGTYDVAAKCRGVQPAQRCAVAVLDRYVTRATSTGSVPL